MISHFLHTFVSFHLFCVVGIRRERIKIILKYCWCHSVCNAAYLISLSDICHYYARKLLQVMQSRVRWGERDSISGEKRVSDKEKPAKTNPSPSTVRNWEFVSSQISKCERILGGFFFHFNCYSECAPLAIFTHVLLLLFFSSSYTHWDDKIKNASANSRRIFFSRFGLSQLTKNDDDDEKSCLIYFLSPSFPLYRMLEEFVF